MSEVDAELDTRFAICITIVHLRVERLAARLIDLSTSDLDSSYSER